MMQEASAQHRFPLLFTGIVAAVYAAALAVVPRLPHLVRADAIVAGLTVDIVVVVPLAFYLLIVRRRGLPLVTLAPVFILSVLAASWVLPADHHHLLGPLEALVVPVELGLVAWIAWRAARALRKARHDEAADPLEHLRRAAFDLTRNDRFAAVAALEIGVLYYALGSWRARPHAPAGWAAFTQHRHSGHAGIVLGLLLVMAVEGLAVHVVLLKWSALVAWLFTIGTAYCALWLIGDYRATVLRPILVDDENILFRAGFRWMLRVPRERVAAAGRTRPEFGKECLNLTFLGSPTRWLTLSEPMLALGPYGFRHRVRAVGIDPDTVEAFGRMLDVQPVGPGDVDGRPLHGGH
ncbi:MAG: hypothetical protein A2W00_05030 [Candidatus Eisenbacteria bacterium RBG_16_71_46]|nr:MAG: hypothetical protein A2W00_05030 [Candidatus Eisenbacteria bacterium RBG_16_71_46]